MARRNGVMGCKVALGIGVLCASLSGERRCFLRAESAIVAVTRNSGGGGGSEGSVGVWRDVRETRRLGATSRRAERLVLNGLGYR